MRPTLDHGTTVWPAFELRWPRRRYRILDYERERGAWLAERARLRGLIEAKTGSADRNSHEDARAATRQLSVIDSSFAQIDSLVGEVIAELPRHRIEGPFLNAPSGPEWTLERFEGPTAHQRLFELDPFLPEAKTRAAIYRVALPPGGMFFPLGNGAGGTERTYDPLGREGDDIFLDVQAIRVDDDPALLAFVNLWGLLGVGIPGAPDCRVDGVQRTGRGLARLSTWFKAIHQLQRRGSAELTREQMTDELLAELKQPLGSQSAIDYITTGRFKLRTLWDALCLRLWENLNGELRLRHCANERCRRIFVPRRKNHKFCTWACGNRWTVRSWKRKRRATRTRLAKEPGRCSSNNHRPGRV